MSLLIPTCTLTDYRVITHTVRTASLTYDGNNNNEPVYCYHIPSASHDDKALSLLLSLRRVQPCGKIRGVLFQMSRLPVAIQPRIKATN